MYEYTHCHYFRDIREELHIAVAKMFLAAAADVMTGKALLKELAADVVEREGVRCEILILAPDPLCLCC